MKKLIIKIKSILSSDRGESLVESLVSIVVFAILVEAVTLILFTAMRMNSRSIETAGDIQDSVNSGIIADYEIDPADKTLTLDGSGIYVEIAVNVSSGTSIKAFHPATEAGT